MTETSDNNEAVKQRWHVDKTISLSHILTTVAMIAGLFFWGSDVEKRISGNALAIQYQEKFTAASTKVVDSRLSEMAKDLREIRNALVKQK